MSACHYPGCNVTYRSKTKSQRVSIRSIRLPKHREQFRAILAAYNEAKDITKAIPENLHICEIHFKEDAFKDVKVKSGCRQLADRPLYMLINWPEECNEIVASFYERDSIQQPIDTQQVSNSPKQNGGNAKANSKINASCATFTPTPHGTATAQTRASEPVQENRDSEGGPIKNPNAHSADVSNSPEQNGGNAKANSKINASCATFTPTPHGTATAPKRASEPVQENRDSVGGPIHMKKQKTTSNGENDRLYLTKTAAAQLPSEPVQENRDSVGGPIKNPNAHSADVSNSPKQNGGNAKANSKINASCATFTPTPHGTATAQTRASEPVQENRDSVGGPIKNPNAHSADANVSLSLGKCEFFTRSKSCVNLFNDLVRDSSNQIPSPSSSSFIKHEHNLPDYASRPAFFTIDFENRSTEDDSQENNRNTKKIRGIIFFEQDNLADFFS